MSQPVALVLGAGPGVGASVAATFASKGYQVVTTSRHGTGQKTAEGYLSVKADFANPSSISGVFSAIKTAFQTAPSVVVYNASSLTAPPDANSALSIPVERFTNDLSINTVAPYVAAQEAVKAWESLPAETKKSFIYTGNPLNVQISPDPLFLDLGVGKSAASYWIGAADTLYKERGYRFFYAGQRAEDGSSISQGPDGPAHAEFFAQLADHKDVPWHATFVKGKGYVRFE